MRPLSVVDVKLDLPHTLKVLSTLFSIAATAGLFSALYKKMRLQDALVAAGVSGAAGSIVGALCMYAWGNDRWYLTCAACGVAGWAGGNVVLDRLTWVAWSIVRGYLPKDAQEYVPSNQPTNNNQPTTAGYGDVGLPPLPPRQRRSA